MEANKYNNGSVKRARQVAVAPVVAAMPIWKECTRNHALAIGGGAPAVDGCREWMPLGILNPADASSYNCAACGCHRNFHLKLEMEVTPPQLPMAAAVLHRLPQRLEQTPEEDSDDTSSDDLELEYDHERSVSPPPPQQPPQGHHPATVALAQQTPAYISSAPHPHMLMSPNSSAPVAPQSQMHPALLSPATAPPPHRVMPARRRRVRTMFTAEQKQRMKELSDRLGWSLQNHDKSMVEAGCRDIGVSKDVFKVWMHNNKHNYIGSHSGRRSAAAPASSAAAPPAPLNPSTSHTSTAPTGTGTGTVTGFDTNGTASPAFRVILIFAAGSQENGTSSPLLLREIVSPARL